MPPPSGVMQARCLKCAQRSRRRSPAIQRVAAEALGRIGDARAVPDLLAATAPKLDRTLEHSLTYALIEIADAAATRAGLRATSERTRRAALIALDQMTPPALEPDVVVPLLDSSDSMTSKTAWWIAGHHRGVGHSTARLFRPAAGEGRQQDRAREPGR